MQSMIKSRELEVRRFKKAEDKMQISKTSPDSYQNSQLPTPSFQLLIPNSTNELSKPYSIQKPVDACLNATHFQIRLFEITKN